MNEGHRSKSSLPSAGLTGSFDVSLEHQCGGDSTSIGCDEADAMSTIGFQESSLDGEAVPGCELRTQAPLDCSAASVQERTIAIPFRKWIKHALSSIGETGDKGAVTSPAYVKAAMKIAKSLTDLMIEHDVSKMLNSMSDCDLTEYVVIHVKRETTCAGAAHNSPFKQDEKDKTRQPLPISTGAQKVRILGDQMASFFDHFVLNDSNGKRANGRDHHKYHAASDSSTLFGVSFGEEGPDYLNVDYVEIRHPKIKSSSQDIRNLGNNERQMIFYNGLLMYELFSGGALPPSQLHQIASYQGAFISLSKLTLVQKSDSFTVGSTKRHHGSLGTRANISLCDLAFENLKLHRVTGSLCLFVLNMLECVYGDLSGMESFTSLSEVAFDLKFMMDRPEFLEDSSSLDLRLHEIVIPREKELDAIHSSYQKFASGSPEIVIIEGESGLGKSWLVQRVGSYIDSDGGLFLTGKFDQVKDKPFSALTSAFDQYCQILLSEKTSNWAVCVADQLRAELGQGACHLFSVIHKLPQVLDHATRNVEVDADLDLSCTNSVQRLHHLLSLFANVISSYSKGPITICMDDVQWADEASLSVLNRLLEQDRKNIFFIYCCRSNEMEPEHPFWEMIKDILSRGCNKTVVKLDCMDENVLNNIMSSLLNLTPRTVETLSKVVHNKTKGNTLFFFQLMHSLRRDGLLRLDLDRNRWIWDEEKILRLKLPDDVAVCIISTVSKLPEAVQSALHTLSMFGASVEVDCLQLLESSLDIKLIDPLHEGAAEGLISYLESNRSFSFCHDRIIESCYQMIEESDRLCNHLKYGKILVHHALNSGDKKMLFTAVNQINRGGAAAISDKADYFVMSKHNLAAGKASMAMSNYNSAFEYFDNSISFLRKNHWNDDYRFSLELYELAAKSAVAKGKTELFRYISHQILHNARCLEDKLNIYFSILNSLSYASKVAGSLDRCKDILSQLGENIPNDISHEVMTNRINQTWLSIEDIPETELANYKLMTDKTQLMRMKFLGHLHIMGLIIRPTASPFAIIRMIQLTISQGKFVKINLFIIN